MNQVIESLLSRKSVRAYEEKAIPEELKQIIIKSAMRAPTAGNQMLYSIVEVAGQEAKEVLARTCDNQPFIARAPLVLLFLADYQRWYDYFMASGVPEMCGKKGEELRKPEEGDLFLACCDALIAAHTAVTAAESMGIGTCYIGDIMENYEEHRELFDLPQYVFPIALICLGYPTEQQKERPQPERYKQEYIVFRDKYKRLNKEEFEDMFRSTNDRLFGNRGSINGAENYGQHMYFKKFSSAFSKEMSRSVREILKNWK
ncbi:MAG TPA: nitroreductase family protein [Clostridia bacterium]|nr:nitroreductase family protein [Clostridia bacterium]